MRCGLVRVACLAGAIAGAVVVLGPVEARADDANPTSDVREVRDARAFLDATYGEMKTTSVRVRDQLRITRKRGTRGQVMCVDEALSRADVALRHARALGDELLGAYARHDADAIRQTRRQLEELRSLTRFAGEQATKCAPDASGVTSGVNAVAIAGPAVTTVRMDVDPRIPRVE